MALALMRICNFADAPFVRMPWLKAEDDTSGQYITSVDTIDRADYPDQGSGPVYIGHAWCDGLVVDVGTTVYNTQSQGGSFLWDDNCKLMQWNSPFVKFPVPAAYTRLIQLAMCATYEDSEYYYYIEYISRYYPYYNTLPGSTATLYRVSKNHSMIIASPEYTPSVLWDKSRNTRMRDWGEPPSPEALYTAITGAARTTSFNGSGYSTRTGVITARCRKRDVNPKLPSDIYNYWLDRVYDMPNTATGLRGNKGPAAAYYAAFNQLPTLTSNGIANILDVLSTIKSFRKGYSGIGSAKDAWLSYRYAYSTTVADIREFSTVSQRWSEIADHPTVTSRAAVYDDKCTYKCAITVDMSQLFNSDLSSKIKKYNAMPTLTNVWDMIPYSFVLDWFTDIGDIIQSIDTWLAEESYPISGVWYSISRSDVTSDTHTREYCRWQGSVPNLPSFCYGSDGYVASLKTKAKRCVDAICLAPFERR